MELIKIAWRNIWRNPTRSLVVIIAVCFGMMGGGFSTAVMIGAINQRVNKAIENESSHYQIHMPGFMDNPEVDNYIPNASEIASEIETLDCVKATTSRLKIECSIASAHKQTGAVMLGVKPADEAKVTEIKNNLIEGDYFTDGRKNEVIISSRMAEELKIKLRSKPVITILDVNNDIQPDSYKVVGIYRTENKMFDEMTVFTRRKDIEKLAGFTPNQSHEISVRFVDNDDLKKRSEIVAGVLPDKLDGQSWKELNPDLAMMSLMTQNYLWYLVAIIMFALAFGIINTMLMSILERKKELGMLMAIGMTQRKIRRMIIWETIFLTAVGSIAGLLFNQILVSALSKNGIDLSMYSDGFSSYGFGSVIYPEINGSFYFQIVALVIFTALISAIFPIIRAGKMKPAEIISSN